MFPSPFSPLLLLIRNTSRCPGLKQINHRNVQQFRPAIFTDILSLFAELSPRTLCTLLRGLSSRRRTPRIVLGS